LLLPPARIINNQYANAAIMKVRFLPTNAYSPAIQHRVKRRIAMLHPGDSVGGGMHEVGFPSSKYVSVVPYVLRLVY